jgi:hypothetical protein
MLSYYLIIYSAPEIPKESDAPIDASRVDLISLWPVNLDYIDKTFPWLPKNHV